jgi:hypothetical protein
MTIASIIEKNHAVFMAERRTEQDTDRDLKTHKSDREMTMKCRKALPWMLNLISSGVEFPTAHERAVAEFRLNDEQSHRLIIDYDKHCAEVV